MIQQRLTPLLHTHIKRLPDRLDGVLGTAMPAVDYAPPRRRAGPMLTDLTALAKR